MMKIIAFLSCALLSSVCSTLPAQQAPPAAATPLTGPVGVNTSTAYGQLDVFGGIGTNFISKEIASAQQDYSYSYLKLFKLSSGSDYNAITLNGSLCATRSNDIGVTQCARVHIRRFVLRSRAAPSKV